MPNYTTSYSTKGRKPHRRRASTGQLPRAQQRTRRPGERYLRHTQGFGRAKRIVRRPRRRDSRRPYVIIAIGCAALLFVASIVWYLNRNVTVSLNGADTSVRINSSIETLIADQELSVRAGDLLAVDDSVLEKRGGEAYSVKVNGRQIDNDDLATTTLTGGEEVEIGDGRDEYEEHDIEATTIEPSLTVEGSGAVAYVETWGVSGRSEVWTGKVSGKTEDRGVVQEAQDCVVRARSVSPDSGSYVALTFDEGPSSYTNEILDILAEHDAKATFFLQGDRLLDNRAAASTIVGAGCEVASNGMNDTDMSELSADDLRSQLTEGFDTVEGAAGVSTAALRPPYGLFSEQNWADAMDLVGAVVTWNLDSGDYLLPGADQVVDNVVGSVGNGNIILLTDGETTGEQLLEALPRIIEQLQEEGYTLVTLSELIATDEEMADAVDLTKAEMPEDAVLPQLTDDDAGEGQ